MSDFKNKFMNILFEPEDLEIDEVEQVEDKPEVKKEESHINAKDILYRKPNSPTFINLNETINVSNKNEDEPYEMSSQISPIFGVINTNKKKVTNYSNDIIESQTNKPSDSHLDIITSPIYGYGNKEDAMENNYNVKGVGEQDDDEQQLHQLFDEQQEPVADVDDTSNPDDDNIDLFRLFGENQ